METFRIEAIIEAAETKSLSKAAQKFQYTPSAFSHLLKTFEKEFGVTIFKRTSQGVELTESGKELYPRFTELVEAEKKLSLALAELARKDKNTLKLIAYSSVWQNSLSRIVKEFQQLYPHIGIDISISSNAANSNVKIINNEADIIFATDVGLKNNIGTFVPLYRDLFYVIAPLGYSEQSEINREELYDSKFIITEMEYLKDYFDYSRFKNPVRFNSDNGVDIINMVENNFGITILPSLFLNKAKDRVQIISLNPKLSRTIGYAYDSMNVTPALNLFLKHLKKHFN